jgi:hypothetical protein
MSIRRDLLISVLCERPVFAQFFPVRFWKFFKERSFFFFAMNFRRIQLVRFVASVASAVSTKAVHSSTHPSVQRHLPLKPLVLAPSPLMLTLTLASVKVSSLASSVAVLNTASAMVPVRAPVLAPLSLIALLLLHLPSITVTLPLAQLRSLTLNALTSKLVK